VGILHGAPTDPWTCDPAHQVPRLDFELTPACDHACGHCYNVWNASPDDPQGNYPKGQLKTDAFLAMMEKAVRQSGAQHITITGGEPLLRKDALTIIERATQLVPSVQLITNGSHVTPDVAAKFAAWKVRSVQLTLLSADREEHDRLKGAACFDDTVRAALDLRDAGVPVQVCFVAMAENWRAFEGVMELCYVLGVRAIAYNRMSPTGWAIHQLDRLMPLVEQVEHNLDTAERLGPAWKIGVATAMPIPPCLIRLERYRWVKFGFCSVGTHTPNITVDALGNVRSCNLSSNVLGNIVDVDWPAIHAQPYLHTFKQQVPDMCRGCAYEKSCQGGCKESGFATYGDLRAPEPFVAQAHGGNAAGGAPAAGPLITIAEPAR
jgi:radical SAM protein with 4Fe4S-binding SPASM domain